MYRVICIVADATYSGSAKLTFKAAFLLLLLFAGHITVQADLPGAFQQKNLTSTNLMATLRHAENQHGVFLSPPGRQREAVLRCLPQGLEGRVDERGIEVLARSEGAGEGFRVLAHSVARGDGLPQVFSTRGEVLPVADGLSWVRPGLIEEYFVSVDGLRQDFVILDRPAGEGELRLQLRVEGAAVEADAQRAVLRTYGSGRDLAYDRLKVIDAEGRIFDAQFDDAGEGFLSVKVDDAGAVYPLRIDPSYSNVEWFPLLNSVISDDVRINAILYTNGITYIAGKFTKIGDVSAKNIAMWNGSVWSGLGTGLSWDPLAEDEVYYGENGTVLATISSAGPDNTNYQVNALAMDEQGNLFAGGYFNKAGDKETWCIAKWDGAAWDAVTESDTAFEPVFFDGKKRYSEVHALKMVGGAVLYVGGELWGNGKNISRLINGNWQSCGYGLNGTVRDIELYYGGDILAVGDFTESGQGAQGQPCRYAASWGAGDGYWTEVHGGLDSSAYSIDGNAAEGYFVGGVFTNAGTGPSKKEVNRIAYLDNTAWSTAGSGISQGAVYSVLKTPDRVYVGGDFKTVDGLSAPGIAQWYNGLWMPIQSGLSTGAVYALNRQGATLVAGGAFTRSGSTSVGPLAAFETRWRPFVTAPVGNQAATVYTILVDEENDVIYAGGSFTNIGGTTAYNVAMWDGAKWQAMGGGLFTNFAKKTPGAVYTLVKGPGGRIFAGGDFDLTTDNNGNPVKPVQRLAYWNKGSKTWAPAHPEQQEATPSPLFFKEYNLRVTSLLWHESTDELLIGIDRGWDGSIQTNGLLHYMKNWGTLSFQYHGEVKYKDNPSSTAKPFIFKEKVKDIVMHPDDGFAYVVGDLDIDASYNMDEEDILTLSFPVEEPQEGIRSFVTNFVPIPELSLHNRALRGGLPPNPDAPEAREATNMPTLRKTVSHIAFDPAGNLYASVFTNAAPNGSDVMFAPWIPGAQQGDYEDYEVERTRTIREYDPREWIWTYPWYDLEGNVSSLGHLTENCAPTGRVWELDTWRYFEYDPGQATSNDLARSIFSDNCPSGQRNKEYVYERTKTYTYGLPETLDAAGGEIKYPFNGPVQSILVDTEGGLIAGGAFTSRDGTSLKKVAAWDGDAWVPVGAQPGVRGTVWDLALDPEGRLLAGMEGNTWNGAPAHGVLMGVYTGPDLAVVGTNRLEIANNTAPSPVYGTDFEDVESGSHVVTFRLLNLGVSALQIGSAVLEGDDTSGFAFTISDYTIQPSSAADIEVTFTPSGNGVFPVDLVLPNNAGSDYRLRLRASTGYRYIRTTQNTEDGVVDPSGNVPVVKGGTQLFTFSSTNNLVVENVSLSGTDEGSVSSLSVPNVQDNGTTLHVDFKIDTVVENVDFVQRVNNGKPEKLIQITYKLTDEDESANDISLALSTDGGRTFDILPSTCQGDFGKNISQGEVKTITWNAEKDWNGEFSGQAVIRVLARDDNGVAWADSTAKTLDTEYGVRPRVTNIRGFDPTSPRSNPGIGKEELFNKATRAIFLDGIGRNFGSKPFEVNCVAEINWNGVAVGGNLVWLINGIQQASVEVSNTDPQPINISEDLGVGGQLEVYVVTPEGVKSAPVAANFQVVPPPIPWTPISSSAPELSIGAYKFLTPNFSLNKDSGQKAKLPEKSDQGKSIPGPNSYGTPISIKADGKIKVSGEGELKGTISKEWDIKGVSVEPKVSGGVNYDWSDDESRWVYGGFLGVGVDITKEFGPYYLLYVPPVYGKMGVHVEVFGQMNFDEYFQPDGGEMDITPGVFAVMGFGIGDFLGVEGRLGLDLNNHIEFNPYLYRLDLVLNAALRANVLVWSSDLWTEEWYTTLVCNGADCGGGGSGGHLHDGINSSTPKLESLKPDQFSLMNRNWLSPSGLQPKMIVKRVGRDGRDLDSGRYLRKGELAPTTREQFVHDNGLPQSEPALDIVGTNRMLLYVDDAGPGRITQNANALRYRRWTGDAWATNNLGSLVWDDGTGDSMPQLDLFGDGQGIAAWQNGSYVLSATSGLAEALAALEIAVGHFDGTNWTAFNLTTNNVMDRSPRLSVGYDNTALLTWQRNSGNFNTNTFIFNSVDSICYAYWNGVSWTEPVVMGTNVGVITSASLAYRGTDGYLVFALDGDGDLSTPMDQEIHGTKFKNGSFGPIKQLTDNTFQDTKPQVVYSGPEAYVAWYQDGIVMYSGYLDIDAKLTGSPVGNVDPTSSAQNFKLITGANGEITVIWEDSLETPHFQNPYAFNLDITNNIWSLPVPLLMDSALERSFAGSFNDTGTLVLAYNKVEVCVDEDNVVTNMGNVTALASLEYQMGWDVGVFDIDFRVTDTNFDEVALSPGTNVFVSAVFRNLGELAYLNATARIFEGNPAAGGTELGSVVLGKETAGTWYLDAGATQVLTAVWAVPKDGANRALYAQVSMNTPDRDPANDTVVIYPMATDYSLERLNAVSSGAFERIISYEIQNVGTLSAPSNTIEFYRDELGTNGTLLASLGTGGAITNGQIIKKTYTLDLTGETFTSAFIYVYAAIDPSNTVTEKSEDNNTRRIKLMTSLDTDGDGLLDGEELRIGSYTNVPDSDGDGLSDGEEVHFYGSSPLRDDTDQDGLRDDQEVNENTDLLNPDTDGDGYSDGVEIAAGTNPLDPDDVPSGLVELIQSGSPKNYGTPQPYTYGTNWYFPGSNVSLRVDRYVQSGSGSRQLCTGWTGTGDVPPSGTDTQLSFTITQPSTLQWNFVQEYELLVTNGTETATGTPAGVVSGATGVWYGTGSGVTLTPVPAPGYTFGGWQGDVPADTNNNPLTVSMTKARNLYANFVPKKYRSLILSARGVSSPAAGLHNYEYGSLVDFAVEDPRVVLEGIMYECVGWTNSGNDPVSGTDPSFSMFVTNNFTLTWNWSPNALLTLQTDGNGQVTNAATGWQPLNSNVVLYAQPLPDHVFSGWKGDVPPSQVMDNPLNLVMDKGRTVEATFALAEADIVVSAYPVGAGWVSGGGTYYAGSNATLTASAYDYWDFQSWSDGNMNTQRVIQVPVTGAQYTARFVPRIRQVTVVATEGGVGSGSGYYYSGYQTTIYAIPNPNWSFAGWQDGNMSLERTITVPQTNITYTASFTRNSPASWFVATNGQDWAAGTNWATARKTIQSVLNDSADGDIVTVGPGRYVNVGTTVGGYALPNRVAVTNAVFVRSLNGATSTVIVGASPIGPGATRGVYLGPNAVLDGFTISNGHTLATGDAVHERSGGGIWADPTAFISNCIVAANGAHAAGGGIYGGTVVNTLIYSNTAENGGGAAGAQLWNATVANNSAGTSGGGVSACMSYNSIVYLNTSPGSPEYETSAFEYSCTYPDPASGAGNVTSNPQFVRSDLNDYRLGLFSESLDAGNNGYVSSPLDLQGLSRIQNGTVDMGAFEGDVASEELQASYAGAAIRFDGVDDHLVVAHSSELSFDSSFTIEAWVRAEDFTASRMIVSKQPTEYEGFPGNYEFRIEQGTGRLIFAFEYDIFINAHVSWKSSASVPAGQYAHVAVVFKAGFGATFFIDGKPVGTARSELVPKLNSQPIRIGSGDNGQYFKGELDELRIWSKVRTELEINDFYDQRLEGDESGLAGYWRMDDSVGGEAMDASGNGHDAVLLNGAAFQVSSAGVYRVSITDTNPVVIKLSGHENHFSPNLLRGRVTELPALGTLYQYDTTNLIGTVPTLLTDPGSRVIYVPPVNTTVVAGLTYTMTDGKVESSNSATVMLDVANALYVPLASYPGAALSLDGTSGYVSVPHAQHLNLASYMTIEAWVFLDTLGQYHPILTKSSSNLPGNYEFRVDQFTGQLKFGIDRGCEWGSCLVHWTSTGSVPTGQWTHVAVTFSSEGAVQFFINGSSDSSFLTGDPNAYRAIVNNQPLLIGRRADGLSFKGRLDEVRLWNYNRSSADIVNNYRQRLDGGEGGLAAYFRMDDGFGPTVRDASTFANIGLLQGGYAFPISEAGVDRVRVPGMDDTVITLGAYKTNSSVDGVTARILTVPPEGQLKQYGSLDPILGGPTDVTDASRRVVYTPPAANSIFTFVYEVYDSAGASPNAATVKLEVVNTPAGRYVNLSNSAPSEPYTTWATAATNIQDAITAASPGDTITVAPGVYNFGNGGTLPGYACGNRVYIDKAVTIRSMAGREVTIIQGGPSMRGAYVGDNAVLEGFTIRSGQTLPSDDLPDDVQGGGILASASAVITNCVIAGNWAYSDGGGIRGGRLFNSIIASNSAGFAGGAYNVVSADGCLLVGNAAGGAGGASGGTFYNSIFRHNAESMGSGGAANGATLYNCTVVSNSTGFTFGPGGLKDCTVYNSIAYYNTGGGSAANYSGGSFHHTCTTPHPGGTGNITNAPAFRDLASGDYYPADGSSCLNAGDSAQVSTNTPSDYAGNRRIQNELVDMGAYETPAVLIVVTGAPPEGGSVSGTGSFTPGSMRSLVAEASNLYAFVNWNDGSTFRALTITVPETNTTYIANFTRPEATWYVAPSGNDTNAGTSWSAAKQTIQAAIDAAITNDLILVSNGVYTTGGRAAAGLNTRVVIDKPVTVLSVNGPSYTSIQGVLPQGPTAVRGVYVADGAVLSGFTIENSATWYFDVSAWDRNYGAGIYAAPGGIVSNCLVRNNSGYVGGGVYGGIVRNSIVRDNDASSGGGLYNSTSESCLVVGNVASDNGGGAWGGTLRNCTVSANRQSEAWGTGGGGASFAAIENSIVYFNTGVVSGANYLSSSFANSCTTPDPGGSGNITADPQFRGAPTGDYRIATASPARNMGNNANAAPDVDLVFMPRIADGTVDMGAYEVQSQVQIIVVTNPADGGTISGGGTHAVGANVNLVAAPGSGWAFSGWSDGESSSSRMIVAGETNAIYIGNFTRQITVSGAAIPLEGGGVSGGGIYLSGSTGILEAIPSTDWIFAKWSDGETNALRGFTAPFTDTVYEAHFAKVTPMAGSYVGNYTVTITNGYFGQITNVLLGSMTLTIETSETSWARCLVPASPVQGLHDIVIQTFDDGETRLVNAFTVNPPGAIHGHGLTLPSMHNLAAGESHTLALRSDGRVAAWGLSVDLGQNNVPSPNTNYVDVGAGYLHSLFLRNSGVLEGAGWNLSGQINVPSPNTNIILAAAGGDSHSLILRAGGVVDAFGSNILGEGADPAGANTGYVAIAAGNYHNLAIDAHGVITAWGANGNGQCNVPAPNTNYVMAAGGYYYSLALRDDGSIVHFGWADSGVWNIPAPNTGYVAVASGFQHGLAIRSNGQVVAWGDNTYGQCNVPAPNEGFVAVAGGYRHSVGLKYDGTLVAWGQNTDGQYNIPQPNRDFGLSGPAVDPAIGFYEGGYQVTINGSALGNGTDITNVTLAGIPADIVNQSSTQVIIIAGAAPGATSGHVVVYSESTDITTRSNGFTYAEMMTQTITFAAIPAQVITSTVSLSASSSSGLPVGFDVIDGPGEISGGSSLTFTSAGIVSVIATQEGAGLWLPAPTVTQQVQVAKMTAFLSISNLLHTYDGTQKTVSAYSSPTGLVLDVTYNWSPEAPVDAGTYAVRAEVDDPYYEGIYTSLMTIGKASADIYLGSLTQAYDAVAKNASVTTLPAGLTVTIGFVGETQALVVGSYTVTAEVVDNNYEGWTTGVLTIIKGQQSIASPAISTQEVFHNTPVLAGADSGESVNLEVPAGGGGQPIITVPDAQPQNVMLQKGDGSGGAEYVAATDLIILSYTNPGTYVVKASQPGDANWEPAPDLYITVIVVKASANILVGNTYQVYDATPRQVSVLTTPAGLPVITTYDGITSAPTNPGVYAVTSVVNHALYQAQAVEQLVIGKASVAVMVSNLVHQYDGTGKSLDASTVQTGMSFEIYYSGSQDTPVDSGTYDAEVYAESDLYLGYTNAPFVITSAPQSITFTLASRYALSSTLYLAASASSGRPVDYLLSGSPVTFVNSTTLVMHAGGLVEIVAIQDGDSNYLPAPSVTNAIWVGSMTQHVALSGNDADTGLSWANPVRTIQVALDRTIDGDTVLVSNGVYDSGSGVISGVVNRIAVTNQVVVRSMNGPYFTTLSGDAGVRGAWLASGAGLAGFTITGASVSVNGAGVYAEGTALVQRCVLRDNSTTADGGGVYGGTLENSALYDNSANRGGGAAEASLVHCTVAFNSAAEGAGSRNGSALNSIVYYNTPDNMQGGTVDYTSTQPDPGGTGNLTNMPYFRNSSIRDLRLASTSGCINAGSVILSITNDLAGTSRPQLDMPAGVAGYDLGAFEYSPATNPAVHRYVSPSGSGTPPFTSWLTAATNLQVVVDLSEDGDTVIVADGIYSPVVITRAMYVQSENGSSGTVIDAQGAGRAVEVTAPAVFEGFTVLNGAADDCAGILADNGAFLEDVVVLNSAATGLPGNGGGICLYNGSWAAGSRVISNAAQNGAGIYASSGTVLRTVVMYNLGTNGNGAGIFAQNGSLVEESFVSENQALTGGGIWLSSDSTVSFSTVVLNQATGDAGGIAQNGGRVEASKVLGNTAGTDGGGLHITAGEARSSVIAFNTAGDQGGGVYINTTGALVNLTVSDNSAVTAGSGIYVQDQGTLWNVISYFNTQGAGDNLFTNSGNVDVRYSDIAPLVLGTGNIAQDPLYSGTNDFHLRAGSPAIDAGMDLIADPGYTDMDGQSPMDLFDMGADEAMVDPRAIAGVGSVNMTWDVPPGAELQLQTIHYFHDTGIWVNVGGTVTSEQSVLVIPWPVDPADSRRYFRYYWDK